MRRAVWREIFKQGSVSGLSWNALAGLLGSPSKFRCVGQLTPACRTEAAYIYQQSAQLYSYLSTSTKHSNDAALRYITFPPLQGVLHLQILVMYINHGEGCCFQHKVLVIVHFCVSSSHSWRILHTLSFVPVIAELWVVDIVLVFSVVLFP